MQVHEAIRQRRSIRKFLPKEISREILEEIVSLARLYPSGIIPVNHSAGKRKAKTKKGGAEKV